MQQFLESLRRDGSRIAEVVAAAELSTAVPSCPGWNVADLATHMGFIHRWVIEAVTTRERPRNENIEPAPGGADAATLGSWLQRGVDTLVHELSDLDPDAPTWHPFDAPQVAGLWPRRQAHETMIHRWDAE